MTGWRERFASRTAVGTLVGLVGVSASVAAYAGLARRASPFPCLLAGWGACLAVTAALRSVLRGMLAGLVGFAAFTLAIAVWLPALGIPLAFGPASALAFALHVATMPSPARAATARIG